MTQFRSNSGFTLIELMVVIGVVATLMAFASVNLLQLQRHAHIQTTVATLVTDLYEQRLRAMDGDTQGRSTTDSYGVYFQTNSYTLFHGTTYNASSIDNVVISYQSPVHMSATTFTNSTLLFTKGSGEISGYSGTHNSVTLINTTSNEQITITLNQYGAVTSTLP